MVAGRKDILLRAAKDTEPRGDQGFDFTKVKGETPLGKQGPNRELRNVILSEMASQSPESPNYRGGNHLDGRAGEGAAGSGPDGARSQGTQL